MRDLVSTDQAREQLRLDSDADALWLSIWIPAVSASVAGWLKQEWRLYQLQRDSSGAILLDSTGVPVPVLDEVGSPVLQPAVVAAALLELASQYRYREGEGDNTVPADAGHGYVLSRAATAQLAPLRKTTVA
ncbi:MULTISPECIES: head-tail connector protein [Xanthomonas]|uniref:phage gp6-like head-tail connector protein n=1 Tax=Xanthomonas TaxID=338 RepID=UPI000F8D0AAA|nr:MULTISPECIES: phage gp6-like head-tail connector protein [Xanthomonas]MDC9651519.1 phage gp6-like head-tail connector protein [Xanthomonas perforans]MDC9658280.1 phage gp6-like head-tail connector protein [Xanthomonas perforans]MDC9679063.1 phage gp6-like head-tail connector protein [Xanthomonas perforans]MDC9679980.1 phage gp6-like head-tail connector protein [Xanthomonas perforans]MDC9684195.1 phage gp6-like head-tail connector protein [Xanthomonas perforans]